MIKKKKKSVGTRRKCEKTKRRSKEVAEWGTSETLKLAQHLDHRFEKQAVTEGRAGNMERKHILEEIH